MHHVMTSSHSAYTHQVPHDGLELVVALHLLPPTVEGPLVVMVVVLVEVTARRMARQPAGLKETWISRQTLHTFHGKKISQSITERSSCINFIFIIFKSKLVILSYCFAWTPEPMMSKERTKGKSTFAWHSSPPPPPLS